MKKIIGLAVVLLLVLAAVLALRGAEPGGGRPLEERMQRALREAGFIVASEEAREASGFSVTDINATQDSASVSVRLIGDMDEAMAGRYLEEKMLGVDSLFRTQPAHYPGIITREVQCPERFLPEKIEQENGARYILYANSRKSYGVCTPDLVAYRSAAEFQYCPSSRTFLESRAFFSVESFDRVRALDLLDALACP